MSSILIKSKIVNIVGKIKGNSFAVDSIWAILGNITSKGMSIFGVMLVARFLEKDLFGQFGTVKGTLTSIAIFTSLGLGYTSTKFISDFKLNAPHKLRSLFNFTINFTALLGFIVSVFVFFLSEFISLKISGNSDLSKYFKLLSIWVVFNTLTIIQVGMLSGYKAFKEMAKINLYIGFFAFISSVLLTFFFSIWGALISLLLTQIFNWLLNFILLKKITPSQNSDELTKKEKYDIIKFTLPISLQEATFSIASWLNLVLLLKYGGYGEVGVYQAAFQWAFIILFIPGILRNVILTHLSENTNDEKNHDKILKRTLLINLIVTILPVGLIYIFSSFIIEFYGDTYSNMKSVLLVVSTATIFMSLSNVYSQAYMSKDKNWLMFCFRLLRDGGIIGVFILLNRSGNQVSYNLGLSILIMNLFFFLIMMITYGYIKKV